MLKRMVFMSVALLTLAGCAIGATGDKKTDPAAAQQFLPQIVGYTANDAGNITTTLANVAGGATLLAGNPLLAAGIKKIDDMIQCYQSVGAVTARIYTQSSIDITNPQLPGAAALAIINEDRLRDNFLACAIGSGGFSAQSAAFEPCAGVGEFKIQGQTLRYMYAATKPELCGLFEQHFTSIRANNPQS